jgi:hypothetical protein
MELMLTSFGIAEEEVEPTEDQSLFYAMPPVNMRHACRNSFMPDYAALLLCDKVILDESSYHALEKRPHSSYRVVADSMKCLYKEGFIKLVDFRGILRCKRNLLQKMLKYDLKMLDLWEEPLEESLNIWQNFCYKMIDLIREGRDHVILHETTPSRSMTKLELSPKRNRHHFVISSSGTILSSVHKGRDPVIERKSLKERDTLRQVLKSYLSYINANIVLSHELRVGFHDWADFLPFYHKKFLSVGQEEIEEERQIGESQKLFEVSFPELAIIDTRSLVKVLQDKRVAELRALVEKAVKGEVVFDREFARSVLWDVLKIEWKIKTYRRIISYVTEPFGFVPKVGSAVQMLIREAAGRGLERKLKEKYRWFYLLSDIVEKPKAKDIRQPE